MDVSRKAGWPRQRWVGVLCGVATQALFAWTVWQLFWFLKDGGREAAQPRWWWNAFLAVQFAVVHSWLLLTGTRKWITQSLAKEFYGCLFCVATCGGLLALFAGWEADARTVWDLAGPARWGATGGFFASWALLFYSLSLTGLGWQTGLTPWWHWLRRQPPPPRPFAPRGAYLLLRHPVYLSFLGLIWFTPRMTWDHALLTGLWTIYIFIGSHLKDERLAFYYGPAYRAYQRRVPGYPFACGPLGRRQEVEATLRTEGPRELPRLAREAA